MNKFNMDTFKVDNLPPNIDCETIVILKQLNKTSRALGELKGTLQRIPNAQILIDALSLQEAKDSSEIENIVTTDDEVYQAVVDEKSISNSAKEVKNYARALRIGYDIIQKKGLITTNDIKKIQAVVSPNHPIRKIPGTVLKNPKTNEVIYTPPQSAIEIEALLSNLEIYINDIDFHTIDSLIKMPIIHYQFESIHPFYDGNGRTGRILNMLYLVQQNLLDLPVLYLSSYIIKNKSDYYRLLQEVRTKESWEEWIVWMLKGVETTAKDTLVIVNQIKKLMDKYKRELKENFSFYSHDLINTIFKHPYTKVDFFAKELKVHKNTAYTYLNTLASSGLLFKIKIGITNYYVNTELLNILKYRN